MSQVHQAPSTVAAPPRVSEQALSATWAGLLAQPGLWPALRWQPAATAQAAPWTTFWATRLDSALSAAQARAHFEAAFTAFDLAGVPNGVLLCIAAIIEGSRRCNRRGPPGRNATLPPRRCGGCPR